MNLWTLAAPKAPKPAKASKTLIAVPKAAGLGVSKEMLGEWKKGRKEGKKKREGAL